MNTINDFPRKTITYEELSQLFIDLTYDELVKKIEELIWENVLTAKVNSGSNGRDPWLYKKYGINKPKEDFTETINEIKSLNAFLSINYYLNKPKEYQKNRSHILKLNHYVTHNSNRFQMPMAINERSFDIWGEEKLLRKSSKLLSDLGLTYKNLNVYNTPEPFFSKTINKSTNSVLIIENKDTWFTIRKILLEENKTILGLDIGLLIYGEGKKIISSIEYLQDKDFSFLNEPLLYYWGDLDFEGINIFYSLVKKVDVKLFANAYEVMLREVNDINNLMEMSDDQNETKDLEPFLASFTDCNKKKIKEILKSNKYIPQEIVNYRILMEDNY